MFFITVYQAGISQPWFCTTDEAKEIQRTARSKNDRSHENTTITTTTTTTTLWLRPNQTMHCYAYVAPPHDGYTRVAYENSIVWLFGHWQFLLVALALNLPHDRFRQRIWPGNVFFCAYAIAIFILLSWITLDHDVRFLRYVIYDEVSCQVSTRVDDSYRCVCLFSMQTRRTHDGS
jgi:hypothetical protein